MAFVHAFCHLIASCCHCGKKLAEKNKNEEEIKEQMYTVSQISTQDQP